MDFPGRLLYDILIFLETILYDSDSELVYRISEILCFPSFDLMETNRGF